MEEPFTPPPGLFPAPSTETQGTESPAAESQIAHYPQDLNPDPPAPIRLGLFSFLPDLGSKAEEIRQICSRVDLIVSLGHVNLFQLSQLMLPQTPGIALLGPQDHVQVPEQFRTIHGSGVSVRRWKIAGISGGVRSGPATGAGLALEADESLQLVDQLDPCDIFLTHSYPQGLEDSGVNPARAMPAIDEYLISKLPLFHFYANPQESVVEEYGQGETLSVGVHGVMESPLLEY